jgi:UDP-N-acetylglucosamine--N-acetylmuramyl-(pentapeptide) pyrophosphoryl-undecaprenol N-acetylglucosamine transferase
MRVVLAGGGTAGHIEPALALADALRQADGSIQVTCLGTQRGLETRLVPLRGYELALIPAVPLPRSVTPQLLTVPGRLASAVHAVGAVLDRVRADVLVGFGGYVATPAYLAAKRHKVPIVVHEANPSPGIANRLGARLTPHVFTGHPDTKMRNAQYLGLPIRRQIAELDRFALGDRARAHFGLRTDLPVLLVFGGSQGARSLNSALAGAIGAVRNAGVQVLHVTGPRNASEPQPPGTPVGAAAYVAVPYIDRMDLAYAAADFALCRAGAMTCAELTAVGLPAAYVPLPIGNGEQRLNALPIVQHGGGLLVEDAELTPEWIKGALLPVLTNIDQVAAMSEAAAALGRKDADRWLAKAVIDIVAAESANRAALQASRPSRPSRSSHSSDPSRPSQPSRSSQPADPSWASQAPELDPRQERTRQQPPGWDALPARDPFTPRQERTQQQPPGWDAPPTRDPFTPATRRPPGGGQLPPGGELPSRGQHSARGQYPAGGQNPPPSQPSQQPPAPGRHRHAR